MARTHIDVFEAGDVTPRVSGAEGLYWVTFTDANDEDHVTFHAILGQQRIFARAWLAAIDNTEHKAGGGS